jgi:S-adenosylmethionine-dependent methyltransferase
MHIREIIKWVLRGGIKMEEIKQVENYYDSYDEWQRLERHKVEFEITKKYIDKYVTSNSRILDIGGGPGKYSIYLASKGHKVILLDLAKKHIEIAKEKADEHKVKLERFIHGSACI